MRKGPLIIGARGSALALAQVELFKAALHQVAPEIEVTLKTITTTGDRSQREKIAIETGAGLKGMFTKEIQEALLRREIDVAVHSLKDVPGRFPGGTAITAVLPRAKTNDVLISKRENVLHAQARIGTSSVRRCEQLRALSGRIEIEKLRGNVPTRLRRLRERDDLDAIVLAQAGLERLGFVIEEDRLEFEGTRFFAERLSLLPAIGQGAVGLECREGEAETHALLQKLNHEPTWLCIRAERELLRLLDGDCNLPVAAHAKLEGEGLRLDAIVFSETGDPPREAAMTGDRANPEELARRVFAKLQA